MGRTVALLMGAVIFFGVQRASAVEHRPFTVKDSIEMTTFSDPYSRLYDARCKKSPDGKHFFVITTRGVLRTNQLVSTLWVYSTVAVDRYLHGQIGHPPVAQLLFRTAGIPVAQQFNSYGSLIVKAQWSSNSQSILSLVEQPNGYHHLFRAYLSAKPSVDLIPSNVDIKDFSETGGTIAYLVAEHMSAPKVIGQPIDDASSDLTGLSMFHLLFTKEFPDPSSFWPALDLWVLYKGKSHEVNASGRWHFPSSAVGLRITVAPNGRSLIAARPVPDIPAKWSQYKIGDGTSSFDPAHFGTDRSGKEYNWPWQYIYVNLDNMATMPLVEAPSGFLEGYSSDVLQSVWSEDSQTVLFTNSYLPLPKELGGRAAERTAVCAVALYTVTNRTTACIADALSSKKGSLTSVSFGASSNEAILLWSTEGKSTTTIYRKTQQGWLLEPQTSISYEQQANLSLFIRQDIDEPPALWATEPKVGLIKELWNPNPQLASLGLGKACAYTWKDTTGYEWHAGLVLPPDFKQGHRYPLVIQTHGFYNAHEFLVDGSYTTGFAARALAAAGAIVLQIEDRADRHAHPAQQETGLANEGLTSAIDHLNEEGLIDRSRVGIIGFSRTAWYVEAALTHEPQLFRAATLIDGVDQSYLTYMLFAPSNPEAAGEEEAANEGKPFGSGLQSWMKNAAGFNLDRVRAPVRIEALGLESVLGEWEIYSSLYLQGKPVDLVYIPSAQHILQKPQQRYASQQGNVDWFRFWLQGYEDPDPAKKKQYQRWSSWRTSTSDSATVLAR